MSGLTNYQVINNAQGYPEFVVIPYEEFNRFVNRVNLETAIPSEVVDFALDNNCSALLAWRKYLGIDKNEIAQRLQLDITKYELLEAKETLNIEQRVQLAEILNINAEQLDF
ncbi:MAG: hypothetical protein J6M05_01545 [Cardiobacteriaceae bacterium]|nr:hypothetical protein [Cardiobacteriaceae bacterium]